MTAEDRGWGAPGCTRSELARIIVPGIQLNVRREVAPLFRELVRWLTVERRAAGKPPLFSSGGYVKRYVRGSSTTWSNHSWGLAVDFNAATNPMQDTLRTDMPVGTSDKARSLGMRWGGDYEGRKDPMHFEFIGTPADARRLVASLTQPKPKQPELPANPEPPPDYEDDDMRVIYAPNRALCLLRGDGRLWPLDQNADASAYEAAGIDTYALTDQQWDQIDGESKRIAKAMP